MVELAENKANSAQLEMDFGLSEAKIELSLAKFGKAKICLLLAFYRLQSNRLIRSKGYI